MAADQVVSMHCLAVWSIIFISYGKAGSAIIGWHFDIGDRYAPPLASVMALA
jgi:hypothetical protein